MSVFHPLEIPWLIRECFAQVLDKAAAIDNPFEQSFFALVHLSYLQPSEDVNKRVSRLAANIPFIRQSLSPVSFLDVPEQEYIEGVLGVYELNRKNQARFMEAVETEIMNLHEGNIACYSLKPSQYLAWREKWH